LPDVSNNTVTPDAGFKKTVKPPNMANVSTPIQPPTPPTSLHQGNSTPEDPNNVQNTKGLGGI
jgi:hypothetical protein